MIAAESEIISVSLDPRIKSAPIPPIKNLFGVVAVDFDYDENFIYFSQVLGRTISRVKVETNEIENMAKTGNESGLFPKINLKNFKFNFSESSFMSVIIGRTLLQGHRQ